MKKWFTIILAAAMITVFPVMAFADTSESDASQDAGTATDEAVVTSGWQTDAATGEVSYLDENGQKETGWQTIKEEVYYFDADGSLATGWKSIGKYKYYFAESGTAGSGLGKLTTGWKTISGHKYYFSKSETAGSGLGKLTTGWKTISGHKYYFSKSGELGSGLGKMMTGPVKISGKWYFFKSSGILCGKGFVKNGSSRYYCVGKGRLATGWTAIGKRAYYFSKKTAKQAVGTKIKYLKIGSKGYLGESYARAIRLMDKRGWKLRTAYNYSKRLKYANRWMRKTSAESYALYGFKYGRGNCYVMASTFYIQAKLLGYNVHQVEGRVDLPHSWTTIRQNGKLYVYDPNFENETGRNGWKIWYGKKGTWRYNHYHNMN